MNWTLRYLIWCLIVSLPVVVLPETPPAVGESVPFAQQTSSKKNASSSQRASRAKAYFNRAKKKLKAKNYEGALQDFQRSYKLYPTKTTKSYLTKLTPFVKKRAAAKAEKESAATTTESAESNRETRESPSVPVQPKSVYEVSDNIYKLTHRLDDLVRRMDQAQESLKPLKRRAEKGGNGNRLERAEKEASETPDDRYAQRELALAYEKQGIYTKAKEIYLRLVARDPMNPDYHYYLGSLFSRMGQPENAKFAFEEALEIDPDHRGTLDALSYISQKTGGDEIARELIQKASHLEPGGPAQILKEVREKLNAQSYQDAISLAEEARQQFPSNSVFPYLLGEAHEAQGNLEGAKKAYRLSMTLSKTDPSPAAALADLYFDQGNYLYAAVTYESALSANPVDPDLRFKQGLSYFRAFEWGKAASTWEDLIQHSPAYRQVRSLLSQVYYVMSLEYNRNGFTDLSRRSFANALAVNPNSGEWIEDALKTAGEYYRNTGLFRNALGAYQDAIDLDPSDAESYTGLGVTYWYMGEREMAVAAWEKSLRIRPEENSAQGWLILANRRPGS